jgi:hypothetical protein
MADISFSRLALHHGVILAYLAHILLLESTELTKLNENRVFKRLADLQEDMYVGFKIPKLLS